MSLKIIFAGTARPGTTCVQRHQAMLDLGHTVTRIDTRPAPAVKMESRLWYKVYHRLLGPLDLAGANRQLVELAATQPCDVLWLEKALTLERATLEQVRRRQPHCLIAGYSPDDMTGNRRNQSRQFLEHLPFYDIYFTTKSFGVAELSALGCPRVEFNPNAYDRNTHRPCDITAADRQRLGGPVGFIGAWEPARDQTLQFLAEQGIEIRIWGGGWERSRLRHPNIQLECKPLWGEDYARGIGSFDINLNFLRKANRDLQTQRSVEIPACGGFMLAERSAEHQRLFNEDKEATYFGDEAELLDKIRHYLDHPQERQQIAAAGRQRCLADGYSYQERIEYMLRRAAAIRREARPA